MFFKFVSGNNLSSALNTGNLYYKNNRVPIINYIYENINNNIYNNMYNNMSNVIYEYEKLIDNIDNKYIIALKFSSFNFNEKYIDYFVNKCFSKKIKCIIDAEDNNNINKYRNIINKLIYKYNKDDITIIKTYQMYRKDSMNELIDDINFLSQKRYLATKLVRGAYYNNEKNLGHLYNEKKDTDNNYNNAIYKLHNKFLNYNIIATHNMKSIEITKNINDSINKMDNNNNKFIVANLMGMNEKYMQNLNMNKGIYIPYGPYRYMLPYLTRRLYENMDQYKYIYK